ncbi:MAG: mannosyltransferase [Polaribacter sp.]|nr:mannosyltransferase [Polaribacter sp.]
MAFFNKHKVWFVVIASIINYVYVAYFLERTSFVELLFCWIFLFGCFYFLVKKSTCTFKELAIISVLFRLILLFATPNLSQDFYRFIWDGRMIFAGFNPYLSTPESFINSGVFPIHDAKTLYEGMGVLNGSHFTNYPPIHQFGFLIAAFFASKSIFGSMLVLRFLLILADIGILYIGKKLLERLHLPNHTIFWYALNPFIIIEMTGNLHFEPVMLFFLILSFYKLQQQKWILGALFMGCAISVKLIPLLFLPLFLKWFVSTTSDSNSPEKFHFFCFIKKIDFRKLILFYTMIIGVIVLLFSPFLSQNLISNYSKSVGLWFTTFEFNASFYYLFREIGYLISGYNEIAIIGKITALSTVIFILIVAFFRKNNSIENLIISMLLGINFYYFLSSTVHPWYIATPLLLCIFTKYRFPIFWSFIVILSYHAYASSSWNENLFLVAFQYILLFSYIIYEIKKHIVKKTIR